MRDHKLVRGVRVVLVLGLVLSFVSPVHAASADISSVENFIRNVIQLIAGLAGLVATGFFVIGGFGYITSSGNPEHLDRSKRTLMWAAIGLAIVVAAFVLSNIVVSLATNAFGN